MFTDSPTLPFLMDMILFICAEADISSDVFVDDNRFPILHATIVWRLPKSDSDKYFPSSRERHDQPPLVADAGN